MNKEKLQIAVKRKIASNPRYFWSAGLFSELGSCRAITAALLSLFKQGYLIKVRGGVYRRKAVAQDLAFNRTAVKGLRLFSKGRINRFEAARRLGARWYGDVLDVMYLFRIPTYRLPDKVEAEMVANFKRLINGEV